MVIDDGLLRQAREFGARLADTQRQAELAKADYHHAVRRLHFAGASMREVAEALELSHQRVHQIIEATGGTGGWKARRNPKAPKACSFCGRPEAEVAKLIAGPGIFICEQCVALVRRVGETGIGEETERTRVDPVAGGSALKCSFCGKSAGAVGRMVAGPGLCMCGSCVVLCEEVLAASLEQ
jgi:hypothetical protein